MAPKRERTIAWHFGDYPEDGAVWLAMPTMTMAYVDFRPRGDSSRPWRRVTVVTHAWIQRQLGESTAGAASWPLLLVVPDGSPEQIRAWITHAVESGGILEANSDQLPSDWHPASGPRPASEY